MHDLAPLTPLGAAVPRTDSIGTLTMTEVTDRALASLAARLGAESEAMRRAAGFIGTDLPGPGHAATGGQIGAFWTGPDQWMVDGPLDAHPDLAAELKAAVGDTASVTEQTDGWCRFTVAGPAAIALFERMCPVDIARMQPGHAARTTIDHLGVFVLCTEAGKRFDVLGPRSAAGSLHHAICAVARGLA